MINKVYDVSKYHFSRENQLLIDTNIWLYIHPPYLVDREKKLRRIYSNALKKMLSQRSGLLVNVIILGEYLNRFSRKVFYARYRNEFDNFKQFRNSPWFRGCARDAVSYARTILKICNWTDELPSSRLTDDILDDFSSGTIDFNDAVMTRLCRTCDWKLVTHDGDFTHGGIEVITANRKLLKQGKDLL